MCAGAAIQAAILSGHRDQNIKNFCLLDVVPMNIGIEVLNETLSVVVKKNTKIPCKKSQVFATAADN